jgi:D-glycero-D-manno-heptose 1,7-bisphosphate phosphatase
MPPGDLRPAVFLDRDGVLNASIVREGRPFPPLTPDELVVLPRVPEACHLLHRAGFVLVVVTNQPDIARGTTELAAVEEINDQLRRQVEVDAIYLCPHDDRDCCGCRKPKPGMLLRAASDLGLDLAASYLVGDRWRDIEAGRQAGCRTVHVDRGYLERAPTGADMVVGSLPEAGRWILMDSDRTEDAQSAP